MTSLCDICKKPITDDEPARLHSSIPGIFAHKACFKRPFVKADGVKNPLHLLPTVALEKVGEVLAFGAKKYAAHNWRKVDKRSRYYSALIRHAFQWWRGESLDSETQLPHLGHLACCALFLLESELLGYGEDDRPTIAPYDDRIFHGGVELFTREEIRAAIAQLEDETEQAREQSKILEQELFIARGMTK